MHQSYICDACGNDLEVVEPTTGEQVRLQPCITCNEESHDHGYQKGYSDAENKYKDLTKEDDKAVTEVPNEVSGD